MTERFITSSLREKESVLFTFILTLIVLISGVYIDLFKYSMELTVSNSISNNYSLLISTSVDLIGFLATALSIVIFLPTTGKIGNLKSSADYKSILGAFIITILVQILIFVLSLMGLILNVHNFVFSFFLLWVIGFSIVWILITIYIFYKLIQLTI